jgi:hypothetical protein
VFENRRRADRGEGEEKREEKGGLGGRVCICFWRNK